MSKSIKGPKKYFPSWRYHESCPEGQIFQNEEDVPAGWVDHPSKIGGAAPVKQGAGSPQTNAPPTGGRKSKADKDEEKRAALLAQARAKFGDIVPATATIAELEEALNPAAPNGNGS